MATLASRIRNSTISKRMADRDEQFPVVVQKFTSATTLSTVCTRRSFSAPTVPAMGNRDQTVAIFFHGWAQNAAVFRRRSERLTKRMLKRGIDCVFLEGPLVLPTIEHDDRLSRQNARVWFFYQSVNKFSNIGLHIVSETLEQSFSLIQDELDRIPKSARISLVGFSQGAVFVHMLVCKLQHAPEFNSLRERIDSCIMIGGFCARPTAWSDDMLDTSTLRSLHVIGLRDTRVPPAKSHELAGRFHNPVILTHSKGHVVPQQSSHCTDLMDFILDTSPPCAEDAQVHNSSKRPADMQS